MADLNVLELLTSARDAYVERWQPLLTEAGLILNAAVIAGQTIEDATTRAAVATTEAEVAEGRLGALRESVAKANRELAGELQAKRAAAEQEHQRLCDGLADQRRRIQSDIDSLVKTKTVEATALEAMKQNRKDTLRVLDEAERKLRDQIETHKAAIRSLAAGIKVA